MLKIRLSLQPSISISESYHLGKSKDTPLIWLVIVHDCTCAVLFGISFGRHFSDSCQISRETRSAGHHHPRNSEDSRPFTNRVIATYPPSWLIKGSMCLFTRVCLFRVRYVLSADVRMQAMAPRLNLSVTVSGLCAAFSVQTMLSSPSLASRFSKSHGLLLALYLLCPVEQMLATVAL